MARALLSLTPILAMCKRVASAKNAHVTVMVVSVAHAGIATNAGIVKIKALPCLQPVKSKLLTLCNSLQQPAHLRCPHR